MNVKSGNAIFTVANIAYLPKALALGKSIQNHTKNKLKVVIFDKKLMLDFDESIIEIIELEGYAVSKINTCDNDFTLEVMW